MTRRLVTILLLIPLGVVLVALSVANRESVMLTFDPFNPGNPALSYNAPFFVWLFVMFAIGVLFGGVIVWLTQGKHRKKLRHYRQQAEDLQQDMQKTQSASGNMTTLPSR